VGLVRTLLTEIHIVSNMQVQGWIAIFLRKNHFRGCVSFKVMNVLMGRSRAVRTYPIVGFTRTSHRVNSYTLKKHLKHVEHSFIKLKFCYNPFTLEINLIQQ